MPTPRHTENGPPAGGKQHFQVTAALIRRDDGRFLIARRPSGGIHGGLWEFPGGKLEKGESLEACLAREIDETEIALFYYRRFEEERPYDQRSGTIRRYIQELEACAP